MANTYTIRGPAPVTSLGADSRAAFIVRTYQHLVGGGHHPNRARGADLQERPRRAHRLGDDERLLAVVPWRLRDRRLAPHRTRSLPAQYLALAAFIVAEAIIFIPLLYVAQSAADGVIESAALVTLIGFAALTLVAFVTSKDFSFLGALLRWGMLLALILIVAGADLRLPPRHLLLGGDDRSRWRSDPLRHLEGAAPLLPRPPRGGGTGAVRLGRLDVLVRAAPLHVASRATEPDHDLARCPKRSIRRRRLWREIPNSLAACTWF